MKRLLTVLFAILCITALVVNGGAQTPTSKPSAATAAPTSRPGGTAASALALKPEELDQILAPIALYPDSLLAQVLMASTYPLEVVQADRAAKANPKLKDSAEELNKLPYDPSVKSLINFPQVLTMMSEKLDWTVKLGDAFLADQKAVMESVQRLRNKAYAQGNLKSNAEQKVSVQPTTQPAAPVYTSVQTSPPQVIVIESASPSVVYVPTYNPTVVYGAWPYPAYPPAYYYPPGYVAGTALVSFGVGMAVGAAWGHAWGGCNWHGGDVDIDVNRNINYNQNINREQFKAEYNNRNPNGGNRNGQGSFQHDPSHRQGVAYRDNATNDRYRGTGSNRATAQSREAYRGRTQSPQSLNRGNTANYGGAGSGRTAAQSYQGNTARQSGGANRDYSGTRSSGFGGVDSGRAGATAASNRGQQSRSGGYSGGSRSAPRSGGGGRSGGGRAGGGRR